LLSLALTVAAIIASYLLIETMIRNAGLAVAAGGRRYFVYLGISLLIGICTALGLVVFLIPGLIIMARWSIATPLLIGGGRRGFEAMGESWKATRGNEFPLVVAIVALWVPFEVIGIGAGLFRGSAVSIPLMALSAIASTAAGVIAAALNVAIYSMFIKSDEPFR
jgi:hypothetical protein